MAAMEQRPEPPTAQVVTPVTARAGGEQTAEGVSASPVVVVA